MLIRLPIHGFKDVKLYFSFMQTYNFLHGFLIEQGVSETEATNYVNYTKPKTKGRTTLFANNDLILVKLNYWDSSIRTVSVLVHEIIHAAKRVLDIQFSKTEHILLQPEEAECYMADYIFEEFFKILKPEINYIEEPRNLDWFYEVTHAVKKE